MFSCHTISKIRNEIFLVQSAKLATNVGHVVEQRMTEI